MDNMTLKGKIVATRKPGKKAGSVKKAVLKKGAAGSAPQNLVRAAYLAHFGESWPEEFAAETPATAPAMPLDWSKVETFLHACQTVHVTYGLGAKVPNDTSVPGKDFTKVDCSGFVRAAIHRATTPIVPFPDGSVVQHEWVRAKGYTAGTVADGKLTDGSVRIAFLDPNDSADKVGHVVLIRNGHTAESHGGVGPDSRPFDGTGWQARVTVYLLTS